VTTFLLVNPLPRTSPLPSLSANSSTVAKRLDICRAFIPSLVSFFLGLRKRTRMQYSLPTVRNHTASILRLRSDLFLPPPPISLFPPFSSWRCLTDPPLSHQGTHVSLYKASKKFFFLRYYAGISFPGRRRNLSSDNSGGSGDRPTPSCALLSLPFYCPPLLS